MMTNLFYYYYLSINRFKQREQVSPAHFTSTSLPKYKNKCSGPFRETIPLLYICSGLSFRHWPSETTSSESQNKLKHSLQKAAEEEGEKRARTYNPSFIKLYTNPLETLLTGEQKSAGELSNTNMEWLSQKCGTFRIISLYASHQKEDWGRGFIHPSDISKVPGFWVPLCFLTGGKFVQDKYKQVWKKYEAPVIVKAGAAATERACWTVKLSSSAVWGARRLLHWSTAYGPWTRKNENQSVHH